MDRLRVERVSDLNFYEAYNSLEVDAIVASQPAFTHEIFYPKLNQEAYTHFYSGSQVHLESLLSPIYRRLLRDREKSFLQKSQLAEIVKGANCEKTKKIDYPNLPCLFLVKPYKSALKDIKADKVKSRLLAYSKLRDKGLIEKDLSLFQMSITNMPSLKHKKEVLKTSELITSELLNEGEHELAKKFVQKLEAKGFIDNKDMIARLKMCDEAKALQGKLLEALASQRSPASAVEGVVKGQTPENQRGQALP